MCTNYLIPSFHDFTNILYVTEYTTYSMQVYRPHLMNLFKHFIKVATLPVYLQWLYLNNAKMINLK